ncbi:hypothetical protein FHY31_001499 [Xanthomonas euvesicatoria]|uniref:Uncharacterized protein n=1 Tax=Xanthomonas euvesicatoria TaxID=456327 RepID=A0AAW3U2B2_XANEU|nr:hypothetical protein [Xanthomonas euvesicatoria]MBB4869774.1 hypothetical protein [Xanthomonas euvesicatoria]
MQHLVNPYQPNFLISQESILTKTEFAHRYPQMWRQ